MKKNNVSLSEAVFNIEDLRQKFSDDVSYFRNFYRDLIARLKTSEQSQDNFFTQIYFPALEKKIANDKFWSENRHKKLFGIPFALKDNFLLKNKKTSAGSRLLSNFIADFSTPLLKWLEEEGAILIGKNTIDELGLGGTGLLAYEGPVFNPHNRKHIIGGSSSGSAAMIARKLAAFALGTDTGDSTRVVSAYGGIVGFKPSFGMISRHGLIPYAPSFDTVGIITISANNLPVLTKILFRHDPKDGASQSSKSLPPRDVKLSHSLRLGYFLPDNILLDSQVLSLFEKQVLAKLQKHGLKFQPIRLEKRITESLALIYQILSYPEAISSHANLTGVYFGERAIGSGLNFEQQMVHNRSQGLGTEIKRRYLIGAFFMDQLGYPYFRQAQNIRQFLVNYFRQLWKQYDFILHPATFGIAPTVTETFHQTQNPRPRSAIMNDYLIIGNLIGLPSLILPYANHQGLPVAINIYAPIRYDLPLIKFGQTLERLFDYAMPGAS